MSRVTMENIAKAREAEELAELQTEIDKLDQVEVEPAKTEGQAENDQPD